jgi:putative oxidoreductase
MRTLFQHVATLAGRILLSAIFLTSGVNHILHWGDTIGFMDSKGIPMPHVLLPAAIVCLLLGGLSVLIGLRARLGAALLILFLVPVTLLFHNFWTVDPGAVAEYGDTVQINLQLAEMGNFMKNLGLLGGLLMVLAFGAGGFSVDMFLRLKKAARQQ